MGARTIENQKESELREHLARLTKLGFKLCFFVSALLAAIIFFCWPKLIIGALGFFLGFILAVANLWVLGQAFLPLFALRAGGGLRAVLGVLTSLALLCVGILISHQYDEICLIGLAMGFSSPALIGLTLALRN